MYQEKSIVTENMALLQHACLNTYQFIKLNFPKKGAFPAKCALKTHPRWQAQIFGAFRCHFLIFNIWNYSLALWQTRLELMALIKSNNVQCKMAMDRSLRPGRREWNSLQAFMAKCQPTWSPSLCAGDPRRGGDVASPRTHNLLRSHSKCAKHRGTWKFYSHA